MKKVTIIGCPGSGKSTLARALHHITGIPLFHLDLLYWNSDGTYVEQAVFLERLTNAMQNDQWIIDGNYRATMEMRIQNCDTVIFLDYTLEVCLSGIRERRGKPRTDMPWIEAEDEEDPEFLELVNNYNSTNRPQVMELLNKYPDKDIYIFPDRNSANVFLNNKEESLKNKLEKK